ncbi:piggyBac transposable element-derived protein 4-like [Onthophagus taurus]|uniref:piggyBac transposable element-derived protein 4-like n=1 Tax=Onthophagus taurus TaxID=166361 RepID=UPI0039BE52B7
MDKKRRRTEKQVDFYDNPSDSQLDEGSNDSSDSEFSENSMDSDYEVVSETEDNNDVSEASTLSTGDNLWTEIPQNPELFIFQENVCFKLDTTNLTVQTLVDLFFSEEFLALLVEQTNLYAKQEIANLKKIKKSNRASQWIDVTVSEMKVFIALLLQMGPCTFPSIEHYWSRNKLYNVMFWRSHMSRNRFQLLLRYFHLVDNSVPSSDRLYKVRPILNHFNDIMSQNYVPNKNICIDESMLLWRGRLYFRQYIKNKKHKYGIKLSELCESDGIVMKIRIYSGKSEKTDNNLGHTTDIVLHLAEDYLDKGYTLHMDNFYNSVTLTKLLTTRKTYVCGTLRKNRKENPQDVINRELKKVEVTWQRNGLVTVCKWKDKREVLTISNMHVVEMVEVSNRNGKLSTKPNMIRDYNKGMSGIDRSDQMLAYYTCLRKTIRWPKKVALHIIEIYIHNAHKIFQKITAS